MFFAAALVVAAASASMALAQDVSWNDATLTQCANTTFIYNAPAGSYYAAVVPAQNACTSDPLAEYYDVTGGSVDYFVNIPSGTQVQVYLADSNDNEWWSDVLTVGDGDSSCLGDASAASPSSDTSTSTTSATSTTSTSTTSTTSTSTSSTPSVYVAPANFASSATTPATTAASDSSIDTPANAATGGASQNVAVSFTLLGGVVLAAAALF